MCMIYARDNDSWVGIRQNIFYIAFHNSRIRSDDVYPGTLHTCRSYLLVVKMMWTRIRGFLGRSRSVYPLSLYPCPCLSFCCCCRPSHRCSRASQPAEAGKAVTATSIPIPGIIYIYVFILIYLQYTSHIYTNISVHIRCLFTRASHGVQPRLGADFHFSKYHGAVRYFFL